MVEIKFKDWVAGLTALALDDTADEIYIRDDSGDASLRLPVSALDAKYGPPFGVSKAGAWFVSPYVSEPGATAAWPIIDRAYFTPMYFPNATDVSALAIYVAAAGAASNVVRLAIFDDDGSGKPGTVLDQGTVAGDSTGTKTLTLGASVTVSGLYWVGAAPQGAGSPGSTNMTRGTLGAVPTGDTGASWASGGLAHYWAMYQYTPGVFNSSPTITYETSQRMPTIGVRVAP